MIGRIIRSSFLAGASLLSLAAAAPGAGAADLPVSAAMPKTMPAEASVPVDFLVGVRIASDYNFRGVSQSNRNPSPQTYFELQLLDNMFYAGFATYKVDLPTRPSMELDIVGGIRPKLGPLQFDLGFIYYYYPGERALIDPASGTFFSVRNTDFLEFAGKVAYSVNDELTVGANVFYAGDFLGTHADATYLSGTAKYTIPENAFGFMPSGFALSAEFGHYFLGTVKSGFVGTFKLPEYNYGNVGLSYTWEQWTLDVRYHNTDLKKSECFVLTGDPRGIATGSGKSDWCGDAVVATLSYDLQGSKLPGVFAPAAR